jgi:hypothetical protein
MEYVFGRQRGRFLKGDQYAIFANVQPLIFPRASEGSEGKNLPLVFQPCKRFLDGHEAGIEEHLGPESCVEQMHDGVFGTADIAVHWHPILRGVKAPRLFVVCRVAEPEEVPRRAGEATHRISLALAQSAVEVGRINKLRNVGEGRGAVSGWLVIIDHREFDGQAVLRHQLHLAILGVNDWNRAAPVALAGDQPVSEAELNLSLADPETFNPDPQLGHHRGNGLSRVLP